MQLAATEVAVASGGARNGERERVFAEHAATLRTYCLHLTRGDTHASEDLVQEAFVRFFGRFDASAPEDVNVAGYLRATARNQYLNQLRGRREIAGDDVALLCGPDDDLERDPERSALLADQVVQVRRCTARLRENQRRALTLCDVDGRSYAEIGQTLGISTEAAAQMISRGRIRLRRELRCEQVHVGRLPRDCRALVDAVLARAERTPPAKRDAELERHLRDCRRCRESLAAASEAGSRLRGLAPLPPAGGLLARIEAFVRDAVQLAPSGLATAVLPAAMLVTGTGGAILTDHVDAPPPRIAVAAPAGPGETASTAPAAASSPAGDSGATAAATAVGLAARRVSDEGPVARADGPGFVPAAPRALPSVVTTITRRTPGDPPAVRPTDPIDARPGIGGPPTTPVTVDPPSGGTVGGGSGDSAEEDPADVGPELPGTADVPGGTVGDVPGYVQGAVQGTTTTVVQTAQGGVTLVHGVVVTTAQGAVTTARDLVAGAAGTVVAAGQGAVAAATTTVATATGAAAGTAQAAVSTVGRAAAPVTAQVGQVVTTVTRRAAPDRAAAPPSPAAPQRRTTPPRKTTPQRRTTPPPAAAPPPAPSPADSAQPPAAPQIAPPPPPAAPAPPPAASAPAPAAPVPPPPPAPSPVDVPAVVTAPATIVGDVVDGAAATVGGALQPLLPRPRR